MNDLSELMGKLEENDKKLSIKLKTNLEQVSDQHRKDIDKVLKENLKYTKRAIKVQSLGITLLTALLIFGLTYLAAELQIKRLASATQELKTVRKEMSNLEQWNITTVRGEEDQTFLKIPKNLEMFEWESNFYIQKKD